MQGEGSVSYSVPGWQCCLCFRHRPHNRKTSSVCHTEGPWNWLGSLALSLLLLHALCPMPRLLALGLVGTEEPVEGRGDYSAGMLPAVLQSPGELPRENSGSPSSGAFLCRGRTSVHTHTFNEKISTHCETI